MSTTWGGHLRVPHTGLVLSGQEHQEGSHTTTREVCRASAYILQHPLQSLFKALPRPPSLAPWTVNMVESHLDEA